MGENESNGVVDHKDDDDCKLNIFQMDHQQQQNL
jgi:hypothetical protein